MKLSYLTAISNLTQVLSVLMSDNTSYLSVLSTLENTLRNNSKIFFCGNGGSAAESMHLSAELTGRFKCHRKALSGVSLATDVAAITCIANDYSYEEIFTRQIEGLVRSGDTVFFLSTSGNSSNLLHSAQYCLRHSISSVALIGNSGGLLAPLVDAAMIIPSNITSTVQEAQLLVGHSLIADLEVNLGLVP